MEYSEAKQKKPGDSVLPNNVDTQRDQQDNAMDYPNNISAHDNAADNPDRIVPEQEKVPYQANGLESLQKLDKNYKRKYFSKVGGKKDIENFKNSYGKVQQAYEGEINALMGEKNRKFLGDQCGYIAKIYAQLRYAKTTDWTSSNKFKNAYKNFETFLKSLEDDDPKKALENLKKAKDSAEAYKKDHGHYDKKDRKEVSTTQRNTLLKVNTMDDICQLYKSYSDKYYLYATDEFLKSGFSDAVNEHITDEEDKNLTEVYEKMMGKDFAPSGKKSTIRKQGMDSLYYVGNGHYHKEQDLDYAIKAIGPSTQRVFEYFGISGVKMNRNCKNGLIHGDNAIMNLFGEVERGDAKHLKYKHGKINASKALNDDKNTIMDMTHIDFGAFFGGASGLMCPEGMKKEDYDKLFDNDSEENYDKIMDAIIQKKDENYNKNTSYRQVTIAHDKNGKVENEKADIDYKFSGKKDIVKKFNLGPFEKYYDDKFFDKDAFKISEGVKMDEIKKKLYKPIWYIMFNDSSDVEKIANNIYFLNCIRFISYISNMYLLMSYYKEKIKSMKSNEHKEG